MIASLLDEFVSDILSAVARGDDVPAPALRVLIRRYAATAADEIGEQLAVALARALDADAMDRPDQWLHVWSEAATVSDDERLPHAAAAAAERLRVEWGRSGRIHVAMRNLGACLAASVDVPGFLQGAIDELERLIGRHYEPGEGIRSEGLGGQLESAAALLAAYDATARLPYAMLAAEIARFAKRIWWQDEVDSFDDPDPFTAASDAARVWCRLAALDADAVYRASTISMPGAAWAEETERLLRARAADARARGIGAAAYALALSDWIALQKAVE